MHFVSYVIWNTGSFGPTVMKIFEYSQGNSEVKYLSQRIVELRISSNYIVFSDLSMYRLRKLSVPPFSSSNIWVENFLAKPQKFYDIGAWTGLLKNLAKFNHCLCNATRTVDLGIWALVKLNQSFERPNPYDLTFPWKIKQLCACQQVIMQGWDFEDVLVWEKNDRAKTIERTRIFQCSFEIKQFRCS
jgi:hypothetical protein